MNTLSNISVEEIRIMKNIQKTAAYFNNAVQERDLYSAKLELEDLKIALAKLEELKIKRERFQSLIDIVQEMRNKGIKIDFARQDFFFSRTAKNADKKTRKVENKQEKGSKLEGAYC